MPHEEILSYEEICTVVQVAARLGISKVRLTGGEPLVRVALPKLVQMISSLPGVEEVSLTTNGTLLRRYAAELKQAGLTRVNVSLDTLKKDKFRHITRSGELDDVLQGIEAARENGLEPVKINTVIMRGVNDDEVLDFARMTCNEGWHVRFIELMPFNNVAEFVPSSELEQRIGTWRKLEPSKPLTGNGPARYYRLAGAAGTIAFISPISEFSFCSRCNRLRLTADGKLRPCLLRKDEVDLKSTLRGGGSVDELEELIVTAVMKKKERHGLGKKASGLCRRMSQIGG
jgi:cyclic pyranopterin phosphate synthase